MMYKVGDNISFQTLGDIVPRQSRLVPGDSQFSGRFDIPLIIFAYIIVFETRIELRRREKLMSWLVIASIADVQTSHKRFFFINDHNFLVVRPQYGIFTTGVA